jgi:long-chain acyl-CoA synthetase
MKRELRGIKRKTFLYDFDLYRVNVPIPGWQGHELSIIDMWPENVEQTIVLQHGFAGAAESWEFQINHFAPNYRVVVPDLRGHGQSDAPYSQYTMDEMVADMHAIVQARKLPEKFILVGHSFGGSICVEYANAYPERIEKLILIATAGEYPLPRFTGLLARVPVRMIRPFWRFRPRWDAEPHTIKQMLLNNLRKWRGWNLLRNLRMETLIITGERDNYFPRYVFEDVGKMVPNAEIIDVGVSKHKVQLERFEAVNRAMDRFIGVKRVSWRERSGSTTARPWIANYSKDTPPTIPIPRQPMHSFLESAASWRPNQRAIIFYGTTMNYKTLNEKVNQFAYALMEQGIKIGDRVMIVLPNSPQFIIAYYAILKVGGVVVLPNPDANVNQICEQITHTGTKILITLNAYHALAAAIQKQTAIHCAIFTSIREIMAESTYKQLLRGTDIGTEDDAIARKLGLIMEEIMRGKNMENPHILVTSDMLANINFTSGTTDEPKGVRLSHRNLVANALQTRHWVPDFKYGKEVFLSTLPFLHSYGMTGAMNVPITIAATMVLLSVFDLNQVLEHIKLYHPTIFPGVPAMYTAINQAPNVREYGLASIKACISGAAPLPVEVQEAFEKLTRGRLVEGYGLTEAGPVTHANPLYGVRKVGSIGIPIPNTDAKIVDLITNEDLPPGKIGELVVRGPQVMDGYWDDDASSDAESILRDGWLYTGDVAVMDEDGYFSIISRKRDAIMTGHYSVYPRDVEEVLYENNKVLEAAVVGVGLETGEQRVKAFVVPRPNTSLSKEELINLCKRRLEEYAVPWEIEFRETLPKSFVGKVLRRMLIEEEKHSDHQSD